MLFPLFSFDLICSTSLPDLGANLLFELCSCSSGLQQKFTHESKSLTWWVVQNWEEQQGLQYNRIEWATCVLKHKEMSVVQVNLYLLKYGELWHILLLQWQASSPFFYIKQDDMLIYSNWIWSRAALLLCFSTIASQLGASIWELVSKSGGCSL